MRARLALLAVTIVWKVSLPATAATNDPLRPRQWGLDQIQVETAWQKSKGAGVIIAVSDTGVDLGHPDLDGKVISGHDYVDNDETPQDGYSHGTHVAGVAAAKTFNEGVAGVAPDAKIMAIRIFNNNGSYVSGGPESITEAANKGAKVINLSWGDLLDELSGGLLSDPEVDEAIEYATVRGALVVAAAGNKGIPFSNPATANIALIVGATTQTGQKAAYSTSGAGVRVYAPGGDDAPVGFCSQNPGIWSAVVRGQGGCGENDYDQWSGTSFAAPHVAGVAALVRAVNSSLTPKQVIDLLLSTADTIAGGFKRVNAAKAVAAVQRTGGGSSAGTGSGGSGGGGSSGGTGPGGSRASPTAAPKAAGGATGTSPNPTGGGAGVPTPGASNRDVSAGGEKGLGSNLLINLVIGGFLVAAIVGAFVWGRIKGSRSSTD